MTMTAVRLAEASALPTLPAAGGDGSRRFRARIIEGDRWGSSGYYPADVIERDGPTVWPAGTQVFFDHPGEAERWDRPERSVLHLAGRIDSTPVYERDNPAGQGLYADLLVFGDVAPFVEARADDMGLSIRAAAETEQGEREGRIGPVITKLVEGISVDFVTQAGAGGRLTALLESLRARPVDTTVAEALPGNLTANDLRSALRGAVSDAHGGDRVWTYVRDYTDEVVWFVVESPDDDGLWQQAYTATDDGLVTLTGTPVQVQVQTSYVPVPAASGAGSTGEAATPATTSTAGTTTAPATESAEPATPGPATSDPDQQGATTQSTTESRRGTSTMAQIEEGRLRVLEAAESRVPALEAENTTLTARAAEAERRAAVAEGREYAREYATTRVSEANSELPATVVARIVEAATREVPLDAELRVDTEALGGRVDAVRTAEESYLARLMEESGVGSVRGVGAAASGGPEVTEADTDAAIAGAFGRRTTATTGR